MQITELKLSGFICNTHVASFYFCSSYWQCPLKLDSYEACCIIVIQRTLALICVLHGLKSLSAYIQSTLQPPFDSIKHTFKSSIENIDLYSTFEKQLFKHLVRLSNICGMHNLSLPAKKSVFYTKELKRGCRIIDSDGYRLGSKNIEAFRAMEDPISGAKLCQFIHYSRRMSTSFSDFHRRMQHLDNNLEKAYIKTRKRRKKSVRIISLHKRS